MRNESNETLPPCDSYVEGWQDYRRVRGMCLASYLAVVLGSMLRPWLYDNCWSMWCAMPLGTIWILLLGAAMLLTPRLQTWSCPRCRRGFFEARYYHPMQFRVCRCVHCGLVKYAPCDPADQPWEQISLDDQDRRIEDRRD